MNSLKAVDLSDNYLNGTLPVSIGNLRTLESIYISNNKLEGEVSELHFANLTRLFSFVASGMGKSVVLRVSPKWIPPLQLQYLYLGSWHIGPQFPTWVRLLKHLTSLDLSNSGISTPVPIWFWDSLSNYDYLNFSHNQMHGVVPNVTLVSEGEERVIDLSSNGFSGVVPYFSWNVKAVDLSNNSFSGSIFKFLCSEMKQVKEMQVVNLDGNLLSGEIPDCWRSWENMVGIKLSNNMFSGNIPNSIGTLTLLESLHLRNNNLFGEVPSSIQYCIKLFILDLSKNNLVGDIKTWIGNGFSSLSILSLHGNKFDGHIPQELRGLVSLRILDLAHNNFSGSIPSCFSNFTRMATRNDSSGSIYTNGRMAFMETFLLVMKGKVMEYSTILGLVRSIDLSDNNLSGPIPEDLTSLAGLLSLNLSHNALSGRIPNEISDMRWLEAIDFSQNQLFGEIPETMSRLHSLSVFNLSYNRLLGKIPPGTQIQSFGPSSFIGNQLCGLPLRVNCSVDGAQPSVDSESQQEGDEDEVVWFYVSMVIGFLIAFSNVVGSLIFIRRWRNLFFSFVDNLLKTIY